MDMSYDFYIKHNMHAGEKKITVMINKNETLINKLDRNWRHLLFGKFNHAPILNMYYQLETFKLLLLSFF